MYIEGERESSKLANMRCGAIPTLLKLVPV